MNRQIIEGAFAQENITGYVGLLREVVALSHDWANAERDKAFIQAEYDLRLTDLTGKIAQAENLMSKEEADRQDTRKILHEQFMAMMSAGQYELANLINQRMMDKFKTSIVAEFVMLKNTHATAGFIQLKPKY